MELAWSFLDNLLFFALIIAISLFTFLFRELKGWMETRRIKKKFESIVPREKGD